MGDAQISPDPDDGTRRTGIWGSLNSRTQIIVAVISVVGTALAAVIAGLFVTGGSSDPKAGPPATGSATNSSRQQSTTTVSSVCSKRLRIVAPTQNYRIADGNLGVAVQVDACELNGDTGWIFDFDPAGDQAYFLDGTPPFAPIAPSDGSWHIVDQGVGSVGDVNTPHTIYLVDASPACARVLHAAKPNADDNVSFKTLPVGCSVVDSVDVMVVAYPSESSN